MAVEFSFKGDTCVAALTGVLDGTSGPLLVEQVKSQISPGGKLVIDFSQAAGLDVNGLRQLLAIKRRLDKEHGHLTLAGMSPEVSSVIAGNGCEGMFQSAASLAAALGGAGGGGSVPAPGPVSLPPMPPAPVLPPITGESSGIWERPPSHAPIVTATAAPHTPAVPPPPPAGPLPPVTGADSGFWDKPAGPSSAPPPPPPPTPPARPAPPAPREPDPWSEKSSPPPPPPPSQAREPEPVPSTSWDTYATPPSAPSAKPAKKGGKGGLIAAASLLILGAAGGGWWWWWNNQPPTIELSTSSITVVPGEDVPEVVLTITRGHLSEDGLQLPKGLAFYPDVDVEDESKMPSPMVYHLKGAPARDAKGGSLTITAVRKGKVSKPVDFQVTIAVPPLKWSPLEIGSALLVAGTPITVSPSYKLVDGAEKLAVKSGSMPAGLAVKEEGKGSWYLSGTPEAAAQAVLTLSAQGTGGKPEERELKLTIAAPAKPVEPVEPVDPVDPVVPVVPVVTPDVPLVKDDGPATPIAGEPAESPKVEKPKPEPVKEDKLDRKMQDFLLTRIQSSAYPEERRNSMAKAVDRITNARHLGTVTFDTGKSELNDKAANSLQESLNSQKNGDYLHTEGLTIIVVGYASTSGNAVKNRALSLRRARAVEQHLIKYMGRAADLVVDYGPTDVLSGAESENQAVEIFAGVVPDDEKVRQLLLELQRELKRKFGS